MRRYRVAPTAVRTDMDCWGDDIDRPNSLTVYETADPWRGTGIIDPSTEREIQGWFGPEPIGFLAWKDREDCE